MKIHIRKITDSERRFAYSQSPQLDIRTGCIGVLHGYLRSADIELFQEWDKHLRIPNTIHFQNIFDQAMQTFMTDEQFTTTLESLSFQSDITKIADKSLLYGVRIDVGKYTFLLRVSTDKIMHNLHCYCYYRRSLDRHMQKADRGIRFITPNDQELFRLDDGDSIRILLQNHYYVDKPCRYVYNEHVEVGCQLYHLAEFADQMADLSRKVIPYRRALPDECYWLQSETGELLRIRKGEDYYFHTGQFSDWATMGCKNRANGVTPLVTQIMMAGITHGWCSREADPCNYNADGTLIQEYKTKRR